MYRFIESIRVENYSVCHLELHQKRINETLAHFRPGKIFRINDLMNRLIIPSAGVYKWRIVYDLNGNYNQQLKSYVPSVIKAFRFATGDDIDYSFKFENRDCLNSLKNPGEQEEVIILKKGNITDTTFSNLIFSKQNEWFTPKSYLLNGIMRQHLIASGVVTETNINAKNIREFDSFQLINAMRPFGTEVFSIHAIL